MTDDVNYRRLSAPASLSIAVSERSQLIGQLIKTASRLRRLNIQLFKIFDIIYECANYDGKTA